ncbi:hypothetical protein CQA09_29350, partial [Klebsiella pneumoniae]
DMAQRYHKAREQVSAAVIEFVQAMRLAIATLGVLAFGSVVLVLARQRSEDMAQRYHKAREQVSAAVIEFVQAMRLAIATLG